MSKYIFWGGSFDPPTVGHFESPAAVCRKANADGVIMVYSFNPEKIADPLYSYSPFELRIAMGEIMASFFPDTTFIFSDIELRTGRHETYEVLKALQAERPGDNMIPAFGDDNLGTDKHPKGILGWGHGRKLIEEFSTVFLRRIHDETSLAKTPMGMEMSGLRHDFAAAAAGQPGWCMLDNDFIPYSSTEFRKDIASGKVFDDPRYAAVAKFSRDHGLYLNVGNALLSAPPLPG